MSFRQPPRILRSSGRVREVTSIGVERNGQAGVVQSPGIPLLIVADDFGFDPAIDRAVIGLSERGLAVVAARMPEAVARGSSPRFGVPPCLEWGLHLNLSDPATAPLSGAHPALCDEAGCFRGREVTWQALRAPSADLVRWVGREVDRQVGAMQFSVTPPGFVHLSGHHHVHALPVVAEAATAAHRVRGLPPVVVRGFDGDTPTSKGWGDALRRSWPAARAVYRRSRWPLTRVAGFASMREPGIEALEDDLRSAVDDWAALPEGELPAAVELMVHVAVGEGADRLSLQRAREFSVLSHPTLPQRIAEWGLRHGSVANLVPASGRS